MDRLKLSPPIGRLFSLLRPMEPRPGEGPFDNPGYFFQIKWDGVRMLAFWEAGRVSLQNRKGHRRTEQYPELQALGELIKAKEALFDGEVVVMEGGKPSFPRVIQRDFCRKGRSIAALAKARPCTYCLFDLLYLDGEDLTGRPLRERLEILTGIVKSESPVYLNENFSEGTALYRQVEKLGLEGIVAKMKESPYLLGQKTGHWLKIKPRRRLLCIVGGLTVSGGAVGALLLGGLRGDDLLYIGRAGSGLSRQDLITLRDYAARHAVPEPPFVNPPREKGRLWLEPRLTVHIEFAEWTGDMRLRAPTVTGFSNRPPEEAHL